MFAATTRVFRGSRSELATLKLFEPGQDVVMLNSVLKEPLNSKVLLLIQL